MQVSICIVNYNVKYFLEQCIHSVVNASKNLKTEIIVVDNNSADDSLALIKEKFPSVKLIANSTNKGYSAANNQAIKIASGRYVLLLNPDTVLQEDTLEKSINFMEANKNAGALGIKMLNNDGDFLPESKRGLPTPSVAFYKLFGLAKLFPRSKKFGQYHLTYLDKNQNHEVDVLSGAFMLLRKETLDKVGLLDESYFMYGEDIDLSYRIQLEGLKNYYYGESSIIHYKGKSTKNDVQNIITFYKAMATFSTKYFASNNARVFLIIIYCAIILRAGIALTAKYLKRPS